jgi:hypothetical protein
MWIFTDKGFFTFVVDKKDPTQVWLRARMREHLEDNFPGLEVTEHPGADYFFRAKVSKAYLAEQMTRLITDADITSHFKDVMAQRAAKPKWGSISQVMYAVWNGAAQWQPFAPYSKTPRSVQTTYWKGTSADRKAGTGQTSLGAPYSYGGSAPFNAKGSSFDWDSRDWGGTSAKDPARASSTPAPEASDEELDAWWAELTDAERGEFLDDAEDSQRRREEAEQDFGAATRWAQFSSAPEVAEVHPAPRNRPGNRRQRRKDRKRKNRHNQEGPSASFARLEQENREGRHGLEAKNRQAYLDKKHGKVN